MAILILRRKGVAVTCSNGGLQLVRVKLEIELNIIIDHSNYLEKLFFVLYESK